MKEIKDFYNDNFGWKCKKCESELQEQSNGKEVRSRLLREGEAESKSPVFSNLGLAKWADAEQRTLMCPRCGIVESIEKY